MEGILIPTPVVLWSHNPETVLSASHSLLDTHLTGREGCLVEHPTLPGGVEMKEIPPPKGLSREMWLPWSEEGGDSHPGNGSSELCHAIGDAPESLCRAVKELHQCLAPLIEEGCLLKLEMLNVVEKDPVTPTPTSAPSSLFQTLRKKWLYQNLRCPALWSQSRLPVWREN